MIRKTLYILGPTCDRHLVMVFWPAEALAQHGGRAATAAGWPRAGGFNPGFNRGFNPGLNRGFNRGFNPGFNRGFRPFIGYGYGYYPYDGSSYYPDYYGSGYYPSYYYQNYSPSTSYYSGTDLMTGSTPASDPVTTVPSTPTAPATATSGTANSSPSGQGGLFPMSSTDNFSRITVRLPADAELWFDGTKMTATGAVRTFSIPPITPGRQYSYTIRAR